MSLIILIIALLGSFGGIGGGPFSETGVESFTAKTPIIIDTGATGRQRSRHL